MAVRSKKKTAKDETNDGTDASGGAGRSIWTGSISFGLLQIPVALHTAESRTEEIHFRQLDKKDLAPITYERVSSKSGKAVAYKDIVKGYELKKAEFVVIEPEELAKANVRATQTLDIQDFVPFDDIEPAFFETPYYLVPQKRSEKAYVLLRDALAKRCCVHPEILGAYLSKELAIEESPPTLRGVPTEKPELSAWENAVLGLLRARLARRTKDLRAA